MADELMVQQAKAQALYMHELQSRVLILAELNKNNLAFDPQERVVTRIRLKTCDHIALIKKINAVLNSQYPLSKKGLDTALGKVSNPTTTTTTVSLDISNHDVLLTQYNKQLHQALLKIKMANPEDIINKLKHIPKGSLIALQQEFDFHFSLVSRIYQKAILELTMDQMNTVHSNTMLKTNALVTHHYAKALKKTVRKNGRIVLSELNKSLDNGRSSLLPRIHKIMMEEIIRETGIILDSRILQTMTFPLSKDLENIEYFVQEDVFERIGLSKSKNSEGASIEQLEPISLKEMVCATTATPNDIIHINYALGLATFIAGKDCTTYDQSPSGQLAHKQIITHRITPSGEIKTNQYPHIHICTPSPALKSGMPNMNAYINDVSEKLKSIKKEYCLISLVTTKRPIKAFIYNSYSSFNDITDDIFTTIPFTGNNQTQSAKIILRGMHRYNSWQLRYQNDEEPILCLVQNIPVNGFGDSLGYTTTNVLKKESTLMCEIALLHTLYPSTLKTEQKLIDEIFKTYKKYLEQPPNQEHYFSNSTEGEHVKQLIQKLKTAWKFQNPPKNRIGSKKNTLLDLIKNNLKKLMAHNLHFHHEFSKLTQVLSVYAEKISIGGCKNGNEQTQAINGRVALLESLANGNPAYESIKTELINAYEPNQSFPHSANQLKTRLDKEYNKAGLHGAVSLISLVDQGSGSAIEAKTGPIGVLTSRRFAEEHQSIMTNLQQQAALTMQAPDCLPKMLMGVWEGFPLSLWNRIKASPFKKIGPIGNSIFLPITLPYHWYDNWRRQFNILESNAALKAATYDKKHTDPTEKDSMDSTTKIQRHLATEYPPNISGKSASSEDETKLPLSSLLALMQTTKPILKHMNSSRKKHTEQKDGLEPEPNGQKHK